MTPERERGIRAMLALATTNAIRLREAIDTARAEVDA